ncbi:alpha/beta fold hydrolase [Siccirubricoccus deserti]
MAGKTYVLLHGAWHGGWCWREVAAGLRALGHQVTTPTQTGLGERRHLLSAEITLETFVTDVVEHIEAEELEDVILVGHSFGGIGITGAADRIPARLRHLVYLDAMVLEDGQSPWSRMPPEIVAERRRRLEASGNTIAGPNPEVSAFGVSEDHPLAPWVRRRLTPTRSTPTRPRCGSSTRSATGCPAPTSPAPPLVSGAGLGAGLGEGRPGWTWQEIATGHDAMVTAPAELTRMLAAIT